MTNTITLSAPRNRVEIKLENDGYHASIFDNNKSEWGFMPTPFTKLCPWEEVMAEIKSYNPKHTMIQINSNN